MRTDEYQQILDELANGEMEELEVKIFHFLRRAYPASLTRYDLLEYVFGYRPAAADGLNNSNDDRKIRSTIANMFAKGVPIVSTSGGAGYRIDIDLDSWVDVVAELEGRKKTIGERIEAAHRIVRKIHALGINAIPNEVPTQGPLQNKPAQLSFI